MLLSETALCRDEIPEAEDLGEGAGPGPWGEAEWQWACLAHTGSPLEDAVLAEEHMAKGLPGEAAAPGRESASAGLRPEQPGSARTG